MLTKKQLIAAAKLQGKVEVLEEKSRKLREEILRLRKVERAAGSSYYGYDGGSLGFDIPLADFLALFPSEQPVHKTYPQENGSTRVWCQWGPALVGDFAPGKRLWVQATTKSEILPATSPAVITATEETQKAA